MPDDKAGPIVIAVLQRGFVYVGRRTVSATGTIVLSPSRCIRRWGTQRGLAQLRTGPTESTTMDDVGEIEYHPLMEVFRQPVSGEWGLDG